jgi:hypothetical protein
MSIEEEEQTKTRRRQGGRRVRARGLGGIAVFDARLLILSSLSLSFSSLAPSLARVRDVLCCLRPSRSRRLRRASSVAVSSQAVFFWGEGGRGQISPNFDLKNMISTYTKDFSSLDFKDFFFKIARFFS